MSVRVEVSCPDCKATRPLKFKRAVDETPSRRCKPCSSKAAWASPSPARIDSLKIFTEAGASARKGVPLTEETRQKLSVIHTGRAPWNLGATLTEAHKANMLSARSSLLPRSPASRARSSKAQFKRLGTTPAENHITKSEYSAWAYEVLKRNNATCVFCGFQKGARKSVNAHHILSQARHPEFRLFVDNGITLCVPCHKAEHSLNSII